MKKLSLLGSTGSIGIQTLDVARLLKINVTALATHKNIALLERQIREFSPKIAAVSDEKYAKDLKIKIKDTNTKVLSGKDALCEAAAESTSDTVLNAIVGIAGLLPSIAALDSGKNLALANKESLVTGGEILISKAKEKNLKIIPVDSEHSAIFQCLEGNTGNNKISKILLTASGGPFFGYNYKQIKKVTKEQALKHPNWKMGNKITIDSATLMNKGLELIEAVWLFSLSPKDIEIIIHRESIMHSAIEYEDHSTIAQLSTPDMRIPIQYALTYPERYKTNVRRLNFTDCFKLTFFEPDIQTFKAFGACINAIEKGSLYPTIANGANEIAVEKFLNDKIKFYRIGELVEAAVENIECDLDVTLENILYADRLAREFVETNI